MSSAVLCIAPTWMLAPVHAVGRYRPFQKCPHKSVDISQGIHYCPNLGALAGTGCVPRAGAAIALSLEKKYTPPGFLALYTPHHIQPVCWGGNNEAVNGVWLLTADPSKYHAQFTAWWQPGSFSVGEAQPLPVADPDLDC